MRLFVYDMLVNVNVIYYVHVCEQAGWACSAGNSAIENLCVFFKYFYIKYDGKWNGWRPEHLVHKWDSKYEDYTTEKMQTHRSWAMPIVYTECFFNKH